jgi:hypothetical protein
MAEDRTDPLNCPVCGSSDNAQLKRDNIMKHRSALGTLDVTSELVSVVYTLKCKACGKVWELERKVSQR